MKVFWAGIVIYAIRTCTTEVLRNTKINLCNGKQSSKYKCALYGVFIALPAYSKLLRCICCSRVLLVSGRPQLVGLTGSQSLISY